VADRQGGVPPHDSEVPAAALLLQAAQAPTTPLGRSEQVPALAS
jgi:hypothetical protein